MAKPESLFCNILENSFEQTVSEIETVLAIPIIVLRGIKSNISRAESIILSRATEQLDAIEEKIYQLLLLNKINQLEGFNNWCKIAFSCQALKNELMNLPGLPDSVKDYINAPYDNFEKYVCKLGLKKILGTFFDDIFDTLQVQLLQIKDNLIDQLKINSLISKYQKALDDAGIFQLLTDLTSYMNCAFETCNWATTASNKMADIQSKYYIEYQGTGAFAALSPLTTPFEQKRSLLQDRINYLLGVCDVRQIDERIPRDKIMDF